MRLRARILLSALSLAGCEGEGRSRAEVAGYVVAIPDRWIAEREVQGPRHVLTLRPPERDAFCQIAVIRDGRIFRDDDARALLGDGRATFGDGEGRPARLETAGGPMDGLVLDEPRVPASWGVRAAGGEPHLEMYAASRQDRLIAAIVATFGAAGDAAAHRERCLEAVRSLD